MVVSFAYRAAALLVFSAVVLGLAGCGRNAPDPNTLVPEPGVHSTLVSAEGMDAGEPAIAADTAGNIFVVYVEHAADKGADIWLQRLDAQGKPNADKSRVNPDAGSAKAWRGDPPTIAVSRDSAIYVGWTRALPGEKGNDLMLSTSTNGGRTFDAAVKVNDDKVPASHGMHSLAIDTNNRIYVAWLDERNIKPHHDDGEGGHETGMAMMFHHEEAEPNSEVFYSVSTDGGKTFAPNKRIATEVCPCCKTTLAAGPNGNIFAAWRQVVPGDHRHIAVAGSTDGGATFSAGVIVSDDKWQIHACPVSGAALGLDGENGLDVLWYTAGAAGEPGLYFAHSADGGKTFSPRHLVDTEATSGMPVLIGSGKRTIAVFADVRGGVTAENIEAAENGGPSGEKIQAAGLPAAALAGGAMPTAFVRSAGDKSAVWLAFPAIN